MRQTFNDSLQAREWEEKVIRRIDAVKSDRWLNKSPGKAIPPRYGMENNNFGKDFSGENNPMYGKTHTEESRAMMSKNHYLRNGGVHPLQGKHHSEESKQKNRDAHLGKPGLSGDKNPMKRPEVAAIVSIKATGMTTVYDIIQGKCVKISVGEAKSNSNRYLGVNSNRYKQIKSAKAA